MLDQAVQYTINQLDSLIYYLEDGSVNIDNNAAERQIHPFAIGRKNWLFMGSPDGAKAAAALYALIETAKSNDVNPEGYLKFLLEHYIDPEADEKFVDLPPIQKSVFFLEINPYLFYNFIGLIKQGIIMNNIMKIIVLSSSFLCATEQGSELFFNLDRQKIDDLRHGTEEQMREAISFYEKHKEKKLSDEEYNWFCRGYLKTASKLKDPDLQNQVIALLNRERLDLYTQVTLADIYRYALGKLTDAVSLYRRIVSTEATDPFSNRAKAQAHIGLGNARDGDRVAHYRQALTLTKDPELQAQAHIGLGNARADNVQIPHYNKALELTNDPELQAQAYIGLGNARDGDRVAHYREALEFTKDPELQAQAHIGLGNARADNVQIPHYNKALEFTKDPELQAQAHIGLGNARDGDRVAHYREALEFTKDPELQAQALIGLGNARDGGANNVAHYRQALELTKDPELQAQALIGLGNARDGGANNVAHYKKALELTKDPELQAQAYIGLGNARDGGANNVAHYRQALELTKDPELQAQALIGLGNARDGDRVAHYKKALELTKDPELQAQAHIGLGNARDGGANNVAHYREALKLTQDTELQAQAHIGLGNARADNVQIPHYKKALELTQDRELQAQAHIGLGNARDGDRVAHYREALELTKDPELQAQALIGLGNAYAGNRDNVAALKEFINAFQIGGQATKEKVYEILEKKAVFIKKALKEYTGTDKQQLKNWWDNTPDPRS
jgi:predicted RNase H-like nuclease